MTSALILVAAAEHLTDISPEDAGDLAALAFRTVRPEQPPWLEIGRRCLSVLCRTQRAGEAIDVADLILANIDDKVVAGEVESQAAQALWISGQLGQLLTRIERVLANGPLSPRPRCAATGRRSPGQHPTAQRARRAGRQLASAALERARASADPEAIAVALHACGEAAHNAARHQLALQNFRELRALTGPLHVADEITALQFLDRYDHAQTLLDSVTADARNTTTSILPALHCAQMWQDYNLGRSDEADAGARTLLDLGRQLGSNGYALDAIIVQTSVALLRGDTQVAATRLSAAERLQGRRRRRAPTGSDRDARLGRRLPRRSPHRDEGIPNGGIGRHQTVQLLAAVAVLDPGCSSSSAPQSQTRSSPTSSCGKPRRPLNTIPAWPASKASRSTSADAAPATWR